LKFPEQRPDDVPSLRLQWIPAFAGMTGVGGGADQYGQLFLLSLTSVERTVLLYSVPHRNLL